MTTHFFDKKPQSWQELEQLVCQAFVEMGYESNRSHKLSTVRGSVEIDVFAKDNSKPIPTTILCECKYWNKPVSQNTVHGFRTVCSDAGAHFGLIISKNGFQSGANLASETTNVHLLNFDEFQRTFWQDWLRGGFMMLAKMRDQTLPILRASCGLFENGLDIVSKSKIGDIDVFKKYSVFHGLDDGYAQFFIKGGTFPTLINDPRGDPHLITKIEVFSHREYIEIAREAVIEINKRYNLPRIHFNDSGEFSV